MQAALPPWLILFGSLNVFARGVATTAGSDDSSMLQRSSTKKHANAVSACRVVGVDFRSEDHDEEQPLALLQEASSACATQRRDEQEHWYPIAFQGTDHSASVVLQRFSSQDHSQLLKPDAHNLGSGNTKTIPINDFIADIAKDTTSMRRTFLAFKVARCGSTLLDSMLALDPRFFLIAEPQIFNMVAQAFPNSSQKDLRAQVYRALVHYMAKPLTASQTATYFDLNSQTAHVMNEIVAAVPEVNHLMLWRAPIEVADSLFAKPCGWLRNLQQQQHCEDCNASVSLVQAIQEHVQHVVYDVGNTSETTAKTSDALPVFWYQQVLDGTLPRWVLEKAYPDDAGNHAAMEKMVEATQYDAKTHKPWPEGRFDHNELKTPEDLKAMGSVWYNPLLVDFKVQHPPIEYGKLKAVKELHFPNDAEEINLHLSSQKDEPLLVRNAMASTGFASVASDSIWNELQEHLDGSKAPLSVLQAEKENYFVWHPSSYTNLSNYHVYSKWLSVPDMDTYQKDPTKQIISSLPSAMSEKLHAQGSVLNSFSSSPDLSLRVSHHGAVTALHYDKGHSLLFQLDGAKDIILWPPSELENLYPYPEDHVMYRRALADPEMLDPLHLPKFTMDAALHGNAGAGDMFYWPGSWAHYIRTSKGPSISVGKRIHPRTAHVDKFKPASQELIEKVEATRYAKGSGSGGWKKSPDFHDVSWLQLSASEGLYNDDDDHERV